MSLNGHIYEFEDFRLDLTEKTLTRNGEIVSITPKVFETLRIFAENPNRLIEKDELMEKLWQDRFVEESNLTFNIKMLRKALGDNASKPTFIETVPKRGYRFIVAVGRVEAGEESEISDELINKKAAVFPMPVSQTSTRSSSSVVALADWRQHADAKLRDESNGHVVKLESVPAGTSVATRSRYLAVLAAGLILGAIGLGYYFFFATGRAVDSLAVLPFVNETGDPNNDYLSEGISDSIINSLSRLPNLKVNSLNSVMRYKGREVDPQAIGRELNVKAVLIGKLARQGDDVTISAELVDRENRRLWGRQYTRKLSEMLTVQNEIAREISDGLRPSLTGEEKALLAKQRTVNNEAYLFYSMGMYYARQNTEEGFEKAIGEFEKAIGVDPNYALAYTKIGNTYQFMMSRGFLQPAEYGQRVELAALRALQIDDTLAEAHACLGSYRLINFDWPGAEKEIKKALVLDPDSAYANSVYAHYLLAIGRVDESLDFIIRASELESAPGGGEVAFAYYMVRRYDKAIEAYRNNLEKNPGNEHAQILLGEAYVAKDMTTEGVAAIEKGLTLDKALAKTPHRWDRYPLMAYAYAANGRRDDAVKILSDQQKLSQERYVSPYNFAIIYTALGDKDRAFEKLSESIDQRNMIIYHLKTRPIFDSLRSDPRYVELLAKMNLTP